MTKTRTDLWTVAQHSAWVHNGNGQFERGLETALVTPRVAEQIRAAGGFVGEYGEAEDKAEKEMYPSEGYGGLIPQASGTFHDKLKVNGLPVYILPTEPLQTYHLIVHQEIRYTTDVKARSPEAAADLVAMGMWDDTNNEVLRDRVRVYTDDEESFLHDTNPGYVS